MLERKNKLPKVVLVGPIDPFRGGISQYNTELYKALKKIADARVVSFNRQYPKWLYPGKDDKIKNGSKKSDKNVSYTIDAYLPFSVKKAADAIIGEAPDLVLLTWWTIFWQPGFAYLAWRLRKRGVKTVFLCHNVVDHDANGLKTKVSTYLLGKSDGYIVHATDEADLLREIGLNKPVLNMKALPVYDQYPASKGKLKKRGRLEVLFFGFIRPYKGLGVLADALASLGDSKVHITVVGETWGDKEELKKELIGKNIPNLELHLEYVDDQDAAEYFNRADIVALPYLTATGSAVVSLAYYYRKPVIASAVGGLKESVVDGKTGWLVAPNSPDAISKIIQKTTRKDLSKLTKHVDNFCKRNSWDNLAKAIVKFREEL